MDNYEEAVRQNARDDSNDAIKWGQGILSVAGIIGTLIDGIGVGIAILTMIAVINFGSIADKRWRIKRAIERDQFLKKR